METWRTSRSLCSNLTVEALEQQLYGKIVARKNGKLFNSAWAKTKRFLTQSCEESPKLSKLQNRGPEKYKLLCSSVFSATLKQPSTTWEKNTAPQAKHEKWMSTKRQNGQYSKGTTFLLGEFLPITRLKEMKERIELPRKRPMKEKYKQLDGLAEHMSSEKLAKRESCRFIPDMSKRPRNERVISVVSIFLVSKHRFNPSSAKLQSSMHHGFID